jgi:tetrahydrodipicolinate N-succinyltransferase
MLAGANHELAESRESVDPEINESINNIIWFSTRKEESNLINMQIKGLKQRMAAILDKVKNDSYAQGIEGLE